jgi:hypothetical protein
MAYHKTRLLLALDCLLRHSAWYLHRTRRRPESIPELPNHLGGTTSRYRPLLGHCRAHRNLRTTGPPWNPSWSSRSPSPAVVAQLPGGCGTHGLACCLRLGIRLLLSALLLQLLFPSILAHHAGRVGLPGTARVSRVPFPCFKYKLTLSSLVHFVLFVRACMETHQRNRLAVSVMPQQMYYTQPISHYSMQQMPPMQPEFPTQLQQAHAVDRQQQMGSGPDQHSLTGATHDSLPSPIQEHGLHPPPVHQ